MMVHVGAIARKGMYDPPANGAKVMPQTRKHLFLAIHKLAFQMLQVFVWWKNSAELMMLKLPIAKNGNPPWNVQLGEATGDRFCLKV